MAMVVVSQLNDLIVTSNVKMRNTSGASAYARVTSTVTVTGIELAE